MKAAAYLRVSSQNQVGDDRYGYDRQIREINAYAERAGIEIVVVFKDAVTGTSVTRSGLQKLSAEAKTFGAVVIASIDRMGRDTSANAKVLAALLDLGLEVHAADFGLVDLADDMSLIQYTTHSLFAHLERNRIVKRTRAAHLAMAERGLLPTGIKTYGYRGENGRAVIDPVQAAVVRRIFELSADGSSLFAIQNILNDEGVPVARPEQSRRQGTPLWHRTVIGKVLTNSAYKGEHRWGKYRLEVPPIVSPELWTRAQKGKRGAYPSSGWVLVGHLRCGVCGRRMQCRRNRKTQRRSPTVYEYYRCQSASLPGGPCGAPELNRARLEAEAETAVRRALSEPETIRQLLSDAEPPAKGVGDELAAIADEDRRWLEAFRLGAITPAELGEYRRELETKKRALTTEQAEPDYPIQAYIQAAGEMSFADLLKASSIVVIATREGLRLTLEP